MACYTQSRHPNICWKDDPQVCDCIKKIQVMIFPSALEGDIWPTILSKLGNNKVLYCEVLLLIVNFCNSHHGLLVKFIHCLALPKEKYLCLCFLSKLASHFNFFFQSYRLLQADKFVEMSFRESSRLDVTNLESSRQRIFDQKTKLNWRIIWGGIKKRKENRNQKLFQGFTWQKETEPELLRMWRKNTS